MSVRSFCWQQLQILKTEVTMLLESMPELSHIPDACDFI